MEYPLLDNTDLPLVLLGGTLCNARLWQPVIERLNVSVVLCITLTGAESAPQASRRLLKVLPPRFLLAGRLFARRDCRAANGRRRTRKSERAGADFR
ncbi:hypothetical protein [Enterobacter hormaechei]|uniref:hypothetical protein n=1 Tax=Enterobacter hormaechei TaxID=158836 RepID=UPI00388F9206